MKTHVLQKAVNFFGSQSGLAKAVGKKQGHVWWWLNKSTRVPVEIALRIEKATRGEISREELRPDLFDGVTVVRPTGQLVQEESGQ